MDVGLVPRLFSRYVGIGFSGKYNEPLFKQSQPGYLIHIWFESFSFSPYRPDPDSPEAKGERYLQNYYLACLLVFLMGIVVQWLSWRRYNWQAIALRDHNPLIVRKSLERRDELAAAADDKAR